MATRSFEFWDVKYEQCPLNSYVSGTVTCNPSKFEHNPSNASQAKVTWSTYVAFVYRYVHWENPYGHEVQTRILTQTGLNAGATHSLFSRSRWGGCNDTNVGPNGYSTWVETTDANTKSTTFKQYMTYTGDWNNNQDIPAFAAQVITHTLSNEYLILPPKGLTASLDSFDKDTVTASASITSWSDNPNIKGTPYTSGGARAWNFQAIIKNAAGQVVREKNLDTGETKEASFSLENLDLPSDHYNLIITVSNDYQATQTTALTFEIRRDVNLYGSVSDLSKKVVKLYGSKDNQSKRVLKLYGRRNGRTKLIYKR